MLPGLGNSFRGRLYTIDLRSNATTVRIGNILGTGATYLNNMTTAIDLHIQIHPGVQLSGASAALPATQAGTALYIDLPINSRVYITNHGTIWGAGGRGGDGDRGKRTDETRSPFVGGGGGGGAGPNSVGGQYSRVDPTGGSFSPNPTDGSGAIAGSTSGGVAGVQDPNEVAGASDGGYARGANAQYGGHAIYFGSATVSIYIDNTDGLIYAGAKGGDGGYQTGSLSGGNTVSPTVGSDTPGSLTAITTNTSEGCAVSYRYNHTISWTGGYSYPSIRGIVQSRPT